MQENWDYPKVGLLGRVSTGPTEGMLRRQQAAELKERGKQLFSQQNYFNMAKIMLFSPLLFSEQTAHFTTPKFTLRKNRGWKKKV